MISKQLWIFYFNCIGRQAQKTASMSENEGASGINPKCRDHALWSVDRPAHVLFVPLLSVQYSGHLARCSVTPKNVKSQLLPGPLCWEPAKTGRFLYVCRLHMLKNTLLLLLLFSLFLLTACVMSGIILNSLLLERLTGDRKFVSSNPDTSSGRISFSRVKFVCWLLFRVSFPHPPHPRITTVARKRPRSFCRKCSWQVTSKHTYILAPRKSGWADYAAVQA